MFRNFKRYSAKKPLDVFLQGDRSKSGKKTDKIGIILDLDMMEKNFDLVAFRKELDVPNEVFRPIVYTKQKQVREKCGLEQFNGNNLGWKATFKKGSKEKEFQETDYALLLNYFKDPSPELLIFSASVRAQLKVGFPMAEKRLNNLELYIDPQDYRLFAKELKKYLAVMKEPIFEK